MLIVGLAMVATGGVLVATTPKGWNFPVFKPATSPFVLPDIDHLECKDADPGPNPDPARRCSPATRTMGMWIAIAGAAATGGAFIR
jgi:hypothetical protein